MTRIRLKKIRTTLGLSQEAFGSTIGMKRSSISLIESGKNVLTERNLLNICREHSISETWFRTGEGDMFSKPSDLYELLGYVMSDLTPLDEEFLKNYLNLSKEDRKIVTQFLLGMTANN